MEQRNLGHSGLRVSAIGLGCNNFGGRLGHAQTKAVVHAALDHGITLFDTADIYGRMGGGQLGGSESLLGDILGPRRKDIVLATKFGMSMNPPEDPAGRLIGGARRYIMQAVEDSLTRLRTDWIDLYQLHQPDPLTPIEETLRALDDLVRQGKVRYIGCSNLAGWQVAEAHWTAKHHNLTGFIACQDEYSLLVRGIERELIPAARACGMGLLPFFPLASGLLTGKYRRGAPPPPGTRLAAAPNLAGRFGTDAQLATTEQLAAFAESCGHRLIELAFGWLLSQAPVASVIAGATSPEQVAQNVAAGAWRLSETEKANVDAIAPV